MITTVRFDNAVSKLYKAFHDGSLDAMDCKMCAVGNMCDNKGEWDYLGVFYSRDKRESMFQEANILISKTGYSVEELIKIESLFIDACDLDKGTKDQQFKGLCAVVEYLCELDNIPNVMDYTKLFETENEQPKYELV